MKTRWDERKQTRKRLADRRFEMTETNTLDAAEVEQTVCDCCRLVPISRLGLDLDEPLTGWERFLSEQGIDVQTDDCGRPAIARSVFGAMVREQASARETRGREGGATSRRVGGGRTAGPGPLRHARDRGNDSDRDDDVFADLPNAARRVWQPTGQLDRCGARPVRPAT